MLPTYFTCSELIEYCGGNTEWARDPRLTGAIATILRQEGYTQRHVHHNGNMERQWSRYWKTKAKRQRVYSDPEERQKAELIERVRSVARVG